MRAILIVLLSYAALAFGHNAYAQDPYHIFEFSPPAGYWQQDNEIVGRRLMEGNRIKGDVILGSCAEIEDFNAGFRLRLHDEEKNQVIFVGFICDPNSGDLYAGYRRFTGDLKSEELRIQKIGQKGDLVPFSAHFAQGRILVQFGKFSHMFEVGFTPDVIAYYAFGVTGRARFFEVEEHVS